MSLSKGLASERAHEVLDDPTSEFHLPRLCECGKAIAEDVATAASDIGGQDEDLHLLDDATEEGFAVLAQIHLDEAVRSEVETRSDLVENSEEDELNWMEEQAVEDILFDMDDSED